MKLIQKLKCYFGCHALEKITDSEPTELPICIVKDHKCYVVKLPVVLTTYFKCKHCGKVL